MKKFLKNVGIDAVKPDVHIRRILSKERLGYGSRNFTQEDAVKVFKDMAKESD